MDYVGNMAGWSSYLPNGSKVQSPRFQLLHIVHSLKTEMAQDLVPQANWIC